MTYLALRINKVVQKSAQLGGNFEDVEHSYSDDHDAGMFGLSSSLIVTYWQQYFAAERFEEDDDPEAAFGEADFNLPPSVCDHSRPDYSKRSGVDMNLNPVSQHEFTDPSVTTTYEISNGLRDTINRGIGELDSPAFKFGNDSNLNISTYGEFGNCMPVLLIPMFNLKHVHFSTKLSLHRL